MRVISATNPGGEWDIASALRRPMIEKVVLTGTTRLGVTSLALGFGNWATGASGIEIDGPRIRGEARRGARLQANLAMWMDRALKNACLLDPVGGGVSQMGTGVIVTLKAALRRVPPFCLSHEGSVIDERFFAHIRIQARYLPPEFGFH